MPDPDKPHHSAKVSLHEYAATIDGVSAADEANVTQWEAATGEELRLTCKAWPAKLANLATMTATDWTAQCRKRTTK